MLKTNILVCSIIAAGFIVTAVLGSQVAYKIALENIEQVSSLTSEGIHYQLTSIFTKPVHISLTMANDSLLKEYLTLESAHLENETYAETIQEYLDTYQKKYSYDSVFLVSTATNRYYNFNGIDRVLQKGNPENIWYYSMLKDDTEYSLNVDNDEVENANNGITVFVNCKIRDAGGAVIGIVGVGLRIDNLQGLIKEYEQNFKVHSYLIDEDGNIEISSDFSGYQKVNFFDVSSYNENAKSEILQITDTATAKNFWTYQPNGRTPKNYVVTRYIPELSWHLVTEGNTDMLVKRVQLQLYLSIVVLAGIITIILLIITRVIRGFNRQITNLTEDRQKIFRQVTEQLYDNIYELNITKNRAAGKSTRRYFESLGVPKDMPFDKALSIIAEKQIKEKFRAGYIATFSPENVMRQYANGNKHLRYDYMMTQNGTDYFWMRIDANLFYLEEDDSIRMFVYRKNIDSEKRQERQMTEQAEADSMTRLYNRTAVQQHIDQRLSQHPDATYGFFIFDIDDFKQVNDKCGHIFGDLVIMEFAKTLREHFGQGAILGRLGGDEFVAFTSFDDAEQVKQQAETVSGALRRTVKKDALRWDISASIGVAVVSKERSDFDTLYEKADAVLYHTKKRGKRGYTFYDQTFDI